VLAELGQPDHPAAALQRVELPAHGAQRLAVAGIRLELAAMRRDRVEDVGGLGEVDVEKLRVEPGRIGGEQALRLLRERRRRRRRRCTALGDRR
jgi:hypothetical protein